MRTEVILSRMEEMERRRRERARRRLFCKILRGMLRAAVMLLASAVAVCVIVPMMELLMQSWGSRIVIECAASYFAILWIGEKIYRREK